MYKLYIRGDDFIFLHLYIYDKYVTHSAYLFHV